MRIGIIERAGTVVRDPQNGQIYDLSGNPSAYPENSVVEFEIESIRIYRSVGGTVNAANVTTTIGNLSYPLADELRGVYPDGTRVKFRGTRDQITILDALTWNLESGARRVDVTDATRPVPQQPGELGVPIEQDSDDKSGDAQHQQYYYLDKGRAWTTRVQTCAALAMWSRTARLSYLSHADAGTDPALVAENVGDYLGKVVGAGADLNAPDELTVIILLALDTPGKDDTSLQVLSLSLNHLTTAQAAVVYRNARCHIIGPTDYVVVQPGGPPQVLLHRDTRAAYLLKKYIASPTPQLVEEIIRAVRVLPRDWDISNTVIYHALQIAKEQGHEALLPSFALLLGCKSGEEVRQKFWTI
ncbi:hypothetical protein ACIBI9_58580 [Nonomuraea sp. NPDC050451]|uniref:hypothetical protein n=1 Tax=Nonomuraea sp. NPDC050451 TaxID=3364364 RepID=UPI0037A45F62